jgi:hypothetical protein
LTLFPLYAFLRVYEEVLHERAIPRIGWKAWLLTEVRDGALVFLVSQLVACAFWPYLAVDYLHHFPEVLAQGQKFEWDRPILFWGELVHPAHLPWTYLPGWMLATTPLFLLGFFLWATARAWALRRDRILVLMLAAFFFNLCLFFILRPVIYNGYRHFLFLVPILVALACWGAADLFKTLRQPLARWVLAGLVAVNILVVTSHLVKLYPYFYVYFNEVVGGTPGANGRFEMDYWGQSLREASLWMGKNIPPPTGRPYRVMLDIDEWQQNNYLPDYLKGSSDLKAEQADLGVILNGLTGPHLPPGTRVIHQVEREGVPLVWVVQRERSK